jgi:class 3 adenylate cyclase/tetratricopeptide (TPR) repeat protein
MPTPAPASITAILASYLPHLQLRLLALSRSQQEPRSVLDFPGAVLFVDLSGFTELTRQFERRGNAGAEELSGILRGYFGWLAEIVMRDGGDVISFAGDAALAVWPATEQELSQATRLALHAALTIQRELAGRSPIHGVTLQQRSALSAGELHAMHLGGADGQWQFLLTGAPLREAGAAIPLAGPGSVALTASAYRLVSQHVVAERNASGLVLVQTAHPGAAPGQSPMNPPVDPALPLGDYVPGFVAQRVVAGLAGWLSEFRNITVLFVAFEGFDGSDAAAVAGLQPAVWKVQQLLQTYEGTVYQFLVDDKGLVLIGAFGLPPRAHEDDALRGVHAAVEIRAALQTFGVKTSIGVATGNSFCGIYGSEQRRQYTALGTAMNTAARLMQAAEGEILCDSSTVALAQKRRAYYFEQLDPVLVKGSPAPLKVYRPAAIQPEAPPTDSSSRRSEPLQTGLVGRTQEREAIAEALAGLRESKTNSLIVLEGEAGIGKSRLVDELLRAARRLQVTSLVGAGQSIERSISYHAWRSIFTTVLGLSNTTESLEKRRQRVLSYLASVPDLLPLAPLLNVVLPLEFAETEITRELQAEARAESARHLLLRLLTLYVGNDPVVVVLDDAHWFDSASWGLARMAAQQLKPAFCLVATRSSLEAPSGDYEDLLKIDGARRFQLSALIPQEVLQLVCQRLGVKAMLPPISNYVLQQTAGNPLFVEELVYALRDSGAIEVRGAECRLGPRLADSSKSFEQLFQELRLPGTVQGIITTRVDRFSQRQQLLIKVASVIGRSFSLTALHDICPVSGDQPTLAQVAEELGGQDALQHSGEGQYEFRHPLIQEVVYEAIPFATRRQLHQATAEWYERTYAATAASYAPLLAHHWSRAEVPPKAIEYSTLAGSQALQTFAILEAVRFFSYAISLDQKHPDWAQEDFATMQARRAHWEFQLGSAYISWSKYEEGREHLERGLGLANRSMPRSAVWGFLGLLGQVMRQVTLRLGQRPARTLEPDQRSQLLELTRAYEGLMEAYYITDKPVPCLYSVFCGLNLAETAGPSPELARCYSSTAALLGFMGMRKWTDAYFRRAAATAQQAEDAAAQAWVSMTQGVYASGLGSWELARRQLLSSIETYDRLGDSRRGDDARANLAASCYLQGDFAQSLQLADRIYSSALVRRDLRVQAEALRWRAHNLVAVGRFGELQNVITELDGLRSSTLKLGGFHRKQDVSTLTALLHLSRGDKPSALETARVALHDMRGVSDSFEFLLERAGIAEVCLRVWEMETTPSRELRQAAADAVKGVGKHARVFPIGKPAYRLYKGWFLSLEGKASKAQELWQQSLKAAELLAMPFYVALAHYQIGRHLPAQDPARQAHLRSARETFERIGSLGRRNDLRDIS